jgi:membrane-associated phospholipid phosphatase
LLKVGGYALVLYTMVGVAAVNKGGMHWFSDGVAGAFMSYAIGTAVGTSFRQMVDKADPAKHQANLQLQPIMAAGLYGLRICSNF